MLHGFASPGRVPGRPSIAAFARPLGTGPASKSPSPEAPAAGPAPAAPAGPEVGPVPGFGGWDSITMALMA